MRFFEDFKNLNYYFSEENENKEITFYSESANDWQHLSGIIDELVNTTSLNILYVASDSNDQGLKYKNNKFRAYKITNSYLLSWLFKNVKTKIMIMTLPDLNQYYLKRSKNLVHYIYVPHSLSSLHSIYRKGAFDFFDTLFCSGPHHIKEARILEKIYNLKPKKLVKFGYGKIDILKNNNKINYNKTNKINFLIAPSWGSDCIIENKKIFNIIDHLIEQGHNVTLRPHPITIKKSSNIINEILSKYKNINSFSYKPDTDSNNILYESDVLISDWSGIAFEFAFALQKPVLFVDTPRKIKNTEYDKVGLESFEVYIREVVGEFFDFNKNYTLNNINTVDEKQINENIFCINNSSKIASEYILNLID